MGRNRLRTLNSELASHLSVFPVERAKAIASDATARCWSQLPLEATLSLKNEGVLAWEESRLIADQLTLCANAFDEEYFNAEENGQNSIALIAFKKARFATGLALSMKAESVEQYSDAIYELLMSTDNPIQASIELLNSAKES